MGVSPLDMQVMIPKTVDVAKQHSSEMHKINAGQQNIVQKETERHEEDTKRVHDRNKAERIYVDEEEKEQKEKENKDKKSNTNEEDDNVNDGEEKIQDSLRGHHFDMSI